MGHSAPWVLYVDNSPRQPEPTGRGRSGGRPPPPQDETFCRARARLTGIPVQHPTKATPRCHSRGGCRRRSLTCCRTLSVKPPAAWAHPSLNLSVFPTSPATTGSHHGGERYHLDPPSDRRGEGERERRRDPERREKRGFCAPKRVGQRVGLQRSSHASVGEAGQFSRMRESSKPPRGVEGPRHRAQTIHMGDEQLPPESGGGCECAQKRGGRPTLQCPCSCPCCRGASPRHAWVDTGMVSSSGVRVSGRAQTRAQKCSPTP